MNSKIEALKNVVINWVISIFNVEFIWNLSRTKIAYHITYQINVIHCITDTTPSYFIDLISSKKCRFKNHFNEKKKTDWESKANILWQMIWMSVQILSYIRNKMESGVTHSSQCIRYDCCYLLDSFNCSEHIYFFCIYCNGKGQMILIYISVPKCRWFCLFS